MDSSPVPTGPALWPDETHGPFRLYLHWSVIDGRQEVVGLELSSVRDEESGWKNPEDWVPTPTPLTADVLRRLTDGRAKSFTAIVRDTRERVIPYVHWWAIREPDRVAELEAKVKALEAGQHKKGRPPKYGADHYIQVALVYEAAYKNDLDPTRAVAGHWSVSPSTASNWVSKARKLGLLGETTRGKPGGVRPTDKEGTP
jgi:hypothetical protein